MVVGKEPQISTEDVAIKMKRRFGSHERLYSKYAPQIPAGAEREYIRLVRSYIGILKEELEETLPKLREEYRNNLEDDRKNGIRYDSETGVLIAVNSIFTKMQNNVLSKTIGFGLRRKLQSLSLLTRKLTVREWKKSIKATLGIDIREDYYLGEFYEENLKKWVSDNVDLIVTIPQDTLQKMKDIILDGYTNGMTTRDMTKAISEAYNVNKRHAEFIARDQISKLNGSIQRAQQLDAGVDSYKWSTVGDERTRESHRELDGKIFSWNEPPENSDGRSCHPGEDYGCRCIGLPVFNKNTLNLPVDGTEKVASA